MKINWKTCFRTGATIFLVFLAIHYWPAGVRLAAMLLGA